MAIMWISSRIAICFMIGIESFRNKLRLRLPRWASDSRYISTGLPDTPDNYKIVQSVAWELEKQLKEGVAIDPVAVKARFYPRTEDTETIPTLLELWDLYTDYKANYVARTTLEMEYRKKYRRKITNLSPIYESVATRAEIVAANLPDPARRTVFHLNACLNWAVDSGIIPSVVKMKAVNAPKDREIDPFTVEERDNILRAFGMLHNHYSPYTRFLFATGCRLGEAVALRWADIDSDALVFRSSYSHELNLFKCTKTGKVRRFPINTKVRDILDGLDTGREMVFVSPTGKILDAHNYTRRIWQPLVNKLVTDGLLSGYRPPYNCRHTFITLALARGLTISQVAGLVGNSPKTILAHYAGDRVDKLPDDL